jgi:hypothetical protein
VPADLARLERGIAQEPPTATRGEHHAHRRQRPSLT